MRNTIKKVTGSLLAFFMSCLALLCALAGCSEKQETARTLTDWSDTTEDIAYGSEYRLTTTAVDSEGDLVDLSAEVTTGEAEKVDATGGRFLAIDRSGYTIAYTAELDGKTYTKTTKLSVVAAGPIVSVGLGFEAVYTGTPFELPEFTAYDYWDGDVSDSLELKLYAAATDTDLEYDGSGSYTFTAGGEYYVLATAENASGVKATMKKQFTVVDSSTLSPSVITIDKTNYTRFSTTGTRKFVSQSEWTEGGLTGEYTGNAIKFPVYGNGYANVPFTLGNRDLSAYTHLSVWITVDPFTAENTTSSSAYINLISSKNIRLLNSVTDETSFNATTAGVWRQYLIPVEAVTEYMNGKTQLEFICASASGINSSNRPNIYVGDVSFIRYTTTVIPDLSTGVVSWYTNESKVSSSLVTAAGLGFTGDYTGAQAIKLKPYSKREARLDINLDYYDLTDYTHLSVWVACDKYTAQTGYLQYANSTTALGLESFTPETSGQWIQHLIPISTVQASYAAYEHIKLCFVTMSGSFTMEEGNSADRPNVYIGDVQFVTVAN